MLPRKIITERGQTLWEDMAGAIRYAEARFTLYGTRQQCRLVPYQGQRMWHVRAALPRLAEPCS
jgi:hypothetical protein